MGQEQGDLRQFVARFVLLLLLLFGVTVGLTWLRTRQRFPLPVRVGLEEAPAGLPAVPLLEWHPTLSLAEAAGQWADPCEQETACGTRVLLRKLPEAGDARKPWVLEAVDSDGRRLLTCRVGVDVVQGWRAGDCKWSGANAPVVPERVFLAFRGLDSSLLQLRVGALALTVERIH